MLEDPVADDLLDVDVAGGGDLAGDDDEAGGQQGLDGDPAVRRPGASIASRTESLIWSAILSGCPSVTDSEVNRRPVTAVDAPWSVELVSRMVAA